MMKNKKICMLRSNPVNPDSRVEKEASALIEAGYVVDIFCWDRERNHKILKEKILDDKVDIYRRGCKASYGAGMKNIGAYLKFQFSMFNWLLCNAKKYDYIHACDFDTAFFSYLPSKVYTCKYVFDIFDFICGNPKNGFERIIKKAQIWLINHADAVIICTEKRKKQIQGSRPKKLAIIHNSPDSKETIGASPIKVDKSKISVVYVGVLLDNRLLEEMISFFAEHKDINLYIAGFGMLEKQVQVASMQYSNIEYLGKISYSDTIALESNCNIMTAIYDPSVENHQYAASNKFYEALMLGKPVIMAKGTGLDDIVASNNIGEVITFSKEGFATGLSNLISRQDEWPDISERMKKIYREKYNWDVMKQRLINLYEELGTL